MATLQHANGDKSFWKEIKCVDLLDELTLENEVGRGSYGAAYKVTIDGVPRIAKRIHSAFFSDPGSDRIQEKFYEECRLLSRLDHPNIVEFVGVHFNPHDERDVTLIMELLYLPLETFLDPRDYPSTSLSVKLHILRDVSCGLVYLHTQFDRPIIHRDLTVTNILLTRDLQAKIVDLGMSKLLTDYNTMTMTMCPGNTAYMPPEALLENPRYDTSLDVFSFGNLALHVEIQWYPTAFYVDPFRGEVAMAASHSGKIEILRRKKWIDMIAHDCVRDVVLHCLRDRPEERPKTKDLACTLKTLCARNPKSPEDIMTALGKSGHKVNIKELTDRVNELGEELEAKNTQITELVKRLSNEDDLGKVVMNKSIDMDSEPKEQPAHYRGRIVTSVDFEPPRKAVKVSDTNEPDTSTTDRTINLAWKLERGTCNEPVVLGSGSYGKVYKACCTNTGKHLAVKVVLDLTKKAADDLEKEVKQLSKLSPHKRVVTYFGACYADHPRFREKCLFVFTEFMPGGSLSSCLEKRGSLSKVLTLHYTRQILEGVEYLHKSRVIHRDIKGSNIMCDTAGSVKLADFGSAKQICSETLDKDKTKYLCGTAPWAAPEVLRGEKAQTQSDIWSVAATVVEMLTGGMPYKEENFTNSMAIIFQVGGNKLNPLMSMKRGDYGETVLTDDVESFLSKCFDSEIHKRPSAELLLTNNLFYKL